MKIQESPLPALAPELTRRTFLARSAAATAGLVAAGSGTPLRAAAPAGKARHILIANAWHCINIGDIAHTPGLIHLLDTFLPEVNVTLWPNGPRGQVANLSVKRLTDRRQRADARGGRS